jgi:hypothetical protein
MKWFIKYMIALMVTLFVASVFMDMFFETDMLPKITFNNFEYLDHKHIMVVRFPDKELRVYTIWGIKWIGRGKVIKYEKVEQYWFNIPTIIEEDWKND